jgi:hypothetical protein
MQTVIPTQGRLGGAPERPERAATFPSRMNEPELCGKKQSLFVAYKKFRSRFEARKVCMGRRRGNRDLCTTTTTLVFHLYTMPATRSKKGKKSKAAAAPPVPVPVPALEPIPAPEPEPEVEHKTVDDTAMPTVQPESSDSTSLVETAENIAEATVVNSSEVVVEMVEDVVGAASELVEETAMEGIEENGPSTISSVSGNVPADSEKEAASKLTLEERKAKVDELRKKMVCLLLLPNIRIQSN